MTRAKYQKILKLFYAFCNKNHGVTFYPYQRVIAGKMLFVILNNLGGDYYSKFSRQSGKTEVVVSAVEFLMIFYPGITQRVIRFGIFAPQKEQTKTDFDRIKSKLLRTEMIGFSEVVDPEESNAVTLQLENGSFCYTFPLKPTSKIESKTLDVLIYEEANNIEDKQKKNKSDPMGTNTNAPSFSFGIGNYQKNYFDTGFKVGKNTFVVPYKEVIRQKRIQYERDGNVDHLYYERFIKKQMETYGEDDESFRVQYNVETILGVGQFITEDQMHALKGDFEIYKTKNEVVVGIDTAKSPDETVVTVKDIKKCSIAAWLVLRGENYEDQFYIISKWLEKNYPDVLRVVIDSTGQGDFMPDMFDNHTDYDIIRVKFSLQSKDILYKNLLVTVRNVGTKYPKTDCKEREHFEMQMLDLQREYKGTYLSVHHPDDPKAHDDYPDSWALAEFGHQDVLENAPDISIIDTDKKEKEKDPKKDKEIERVFDEEDEDDDVIGIG